MVKEESLKSHSREGPGVCANYTGARRLHYAAYWLQAAVQGSAALWNGELQYLRQVEHILKRCLQEGRTAWHWHPVGVWHAGTIQPVLEEMLWFIKGSTNAKELSPEGLRSWDANGS